MARIVHYLNQFFIGAGGEDAAASPPSSQAGPVGPGRRLAQLLGDELALLGVPATSAVELPAAVILGSLSPLGWGRLTCAEEEG